MRIPNPLIASRSPSRSNGRQQAGVGLIEVLVAIVVLAIGLTGIAAVQLKSLSGNNSALTRSSAVVASYSVLEILRVQRTDALDLDQNMDASDCDASGSAYIVEQLNRWCENELATLVGPSSLGRVQCDAIGACTVTITFHTLDCGKSGDGQQADGLCTQTVDDGRAQQVVTRTML